MFRPHLDDQAAALARTHGVGSDALLGAVCAVLVYRVTDRESVQVGHGGHMTSVRLGPSTTFREVLDQFRSAAASKDADVVVLAGEMKTDRTAAVSAERLTTLLPGLVRTPDQPIR